MGGKVDNRRESRSFVMRSLYVAALGVGLLLILVGAGELWTVCLATPSAQSGAYVPGPALLALRSLGLTIAIPLLAGFLLMRWSFKRLRGG